jgi:hypothetical protein
MTHLSPMHQPPGALTIDRAVTELKASPAAVAEAISRALVRNYGSDKAGTICDAIVRGVQMKARAEGQPQREVLDAPFVDCDAAGQVSTWADPAPDSWETRTQRLDRATFAAWVVAACLVGAGLAVATGGALPFAGGW